MTQFFASPLSWWQWLLFASLPPAILALYFLKLKRQPLEVPSTFLWHQTLEDLHVNSLWQKLRQSLLLLLQLLLLGLLMLACLRPNWTGDELIEDRVILLVDTSASMSATDVAPSRLEEAKKQAAAVLDRMRPRDAAMIISFSDRARVEHPFTTDQRALRRRLDAIQPTQRTSDISEALRAAAGLANPGRSAEDAADTPAADPLPAEVFIFSDGRYRSIPEFSWGNLQPRFVAIGEPDVVNVAVTAFQCDAVPGQLDKLQALAQVENFSTAPADVEMSLFLNDSLLDATSVHVEPGKTGGAEFALDRLDDGHLRIEIAGGDALPLDNLAFAAINRPERPRVLLVSGGSEALQLVLSTEAVSRAIQLDVIGSDELTSDDYKRKAADGFWELVIYDACQPADAPKANTVYLGGTPPGEEWQRGDTQQVPQIIDTDLSHPLMTFLDFGNVTIATGTVLTGPLGSRVLLEADAGPIGLIAPRASYEDVVFGFGLVAVEPSGDVFANTDWPIRLSFPVFIRNALQYLAGVAAIQNQAIIRVGQPVEIRVERQESLLVETPDGRTVELGREPDGVFHFQETDQVGIYRYNVTNENGAETRGFAVNLFDPTESNLQPERQVRTAWNSVEAQTALQTKRHDAWRWFAMLALVTLIVEWYIYNRRVFL